MRPKTATRSGWLSWLLIVGLIAVGCLFEILNRTARSARDEGSLLQLGGWWIVTLACATVGALVVARYPRNLIGWLLAGIGLNIAVSIASDAYVFHVLIAHPGRLPGSGYAAWLMFLTSSILYLPLFAGFFLFFPNGRPLTGRWRPVVWLLVVGAGLQLLSAFEPGPFSYFPYEDDVTIVNPLGIPGTDAVLGPAGSLGLLLVALSAVAGLVSLLLRMKRARGVERQQLKWFAFAGLIVVTIWVIGPVSNSVLSLGIGNEVFNSLALAGFGALPLASGIAILKHNLYDIDRIINRTLVYGLLTAVLLALYLAAVLGLGGLLSAVSGASSSLVTAGSTLAVAALFRPLRSHIQGVVDRRFYRRKYDAARALEAFSARLRDQVDLDTLSADLRAVVQETMQPSHVSLWLRSSDQTT